MNRKRPIVVAVIIPKYGLIGGAESFAFEVTERLAERKDFEIHVFANRWRQGTPAILFHRIPIVMFPRWLRPISFARFVEKAIGAGAFDIVHSHERIFHMDLFSFHGIPHRTWVEKMRRKRLSLFDRTTAWVEEKGIQCRPYPIIAPVSILVKKELLRSYDVVESRIQVISPGVSRDFYSGRDKGACRNEIRRRHGLSADDVVVLFVGMNFEIKRLELVLKGAACVDRGEQGRTRLKVLVVGKGDRQRYQSMANDLGIGDDVVFAGVTLDVQSYYLASDIFIMPSRLDTFGLVVLEAMAGGLPVIVTETVGAKDCIDDGLNGFVLPENPLPADIASVLTVLLDHETRTRMGENARRAAFSQDWSNAAEQIADLYHGLAERKEGRLAASTRERSGMARAEMKLR